MIHHHWTLKSVVSTQKWSGSYWALSDKVHFSQASPEVFIRPERQKWRTFMLFHLLYHLLQDQHKSWRSALSPFLSNQTKKLKTAHSLVFYDCIRGFLTESDRAFDALPSSVSWISVVLLFTEIQAFYWFLSCWFVDNKGTK